MDHIQEMRESDLVKEKDLGNGIHSINFTRKCFNKKKWDDITTKARGLFIDTENNDKVIARSFDKFFAIGERPETQLDVVIKNIQYPVHFYQKYNGFLGILSAGKDGHLFAASKSTDKGEFAEYFKAILMRHFELYQIDENELYYFLKENDYSLVFEVIDHIHDPHIVEYEASGLVLLECVYNTIEEYKHVSYPELLIIGKRFDFFVKTLSYSVYTVEEFLDVLDIVNNMTGIEGYVLEDNVGHMYKVKTQWYQKWKYYRSMMERVIAGKGPTDRMVKAYFDIIKTFVDMFIEENGHVPKSVIELRKFMKVKSDNGE